MSAVRPCFSLPERDDGNDLTSFARFETVLSHAFERFPVLHPLQLSELVGAIEVALQSALEELHATLGTIDCREILDYLERSCIAPSQKERQKLEKPEVLRPKLIKGRWPPESVQARELAVRVGSLMELRRCSLMETEYKGRVAQAITNASSDRRWPALEFQRPCSVCCGVATSTANVLPRGIGFQQSCSSCGHTASPDDGCICVCSACKQARSTVWEELREVFSECQAEIETFRLTCAREDQADRQLVAEYLDSDKLQADLLRLFEINKNDVPWKLRQVLNLEPMDVHDFETGLEDVFRPYPDPAHQASLLEEAKRIGILKVLCLPVTRTPESFREFLARNLALFSLLERDLPNQCSLEDVLDDLLETEKSAQNPSASSCLRFYKTCVDLVHTDGTLRVFGGKPTRSLWFRFGAHAPQPKTIFNTNFIAQPNKNPRLDPPNHAGLKQVARSNTEANAYHRVLAENPGCMVQVNYLVKEVLKLDLIKHRMSKEAYYYLRRGAKFDLVICDEAGWPLRVEEVQRGLHHGELEWIEKDRWKREACALAGLPFVESP